MYDKKSVYSTIFFLCIPFYGQESIRYTTKQGLPSNHVYDIKQDSKGIMWFGTNRGVVKFDGTNFKTFTVKDGLPNNDIWYLETDCQNRVWYHSKSKFQGFIKSDSVYKFATQDSVVISPVVIKSKDRIWLKGGSFGFYTLQNNMLKNMFKSEILRLKEFHKNYTYAYFDPELLYYILIKEDLIVIVDQKLKLINELKLNTKLVGKNFYFGLLSDQTYSLILQEGILFFDLKSKQTRYYTYKNIINRKKVSKVKVYRNEPDTEIQVSVDGHLMIFNYNFELTKTISLPNILGNSYSYQDKDNNIWQIDMGKGVTFLPNAQLQTQYHLKDKKTKKIGMVNNMLFVGVEADGFYEFNEQGNVFIPRKDLKTSKTIYHIKSNSKTKTEYLISSDEMYEFRNNRFSKILFNPSVYYYGNSKDIIQFDDLTYHLTSSGLIIKDIETNRIITQKAKVGLLCAEVFNNNLYIGGSDGLHLYSHDTLLSPIKKHELLETSISYMSSTDEHLMVGTDGRGVYFYNKDKVIPIPSTDGLIVQKIIKTGNDLWLATQNGVKKISLDTNNLSNSQITNAFYEADGLVQNNTNDVFLQGNTLYAASDEGLAKINLKSPIYQKAPQLYFKTKQDTLHVEYNKKNHISVSFSVLDFVNQDHFKYQYRLLPNQTEWTSTTTKTLNFSNLSPNIYTLEVSVEDQHNNQAVQKQYIHIIPLWWQTQWAKVGLILTSLVLFAIFINFLQYQIRNKEQKNAERQKRITGLELQALRSQMNPHFVHNSLNAIRYYIQNNELTRSEEYLVKFSKLIRLFFEYSRKQNITIENEITLLNNYLQIEQLRFENKLQYQIQVDETIDAEEQIIPSMILQPIVENAINHGLFHKQGKGMVNINFKHINRTTFQASVEDNGVGIKKAKEIYNTSSKNYQSRSSDVLEERLDLLKQSRDWIVTYEIQNLSKINNTTGTLVSITFKQILNEYNSYTRR